MPFGSNRGEARGSGAIAGIVALIALSCLLVSACVAVVLFPRDTARLVEPVLPSLAEALSGGAASPADMAEMLVATNDADLSTEGEREAYREAHKGHPALNPLVAQCNGVDLHSPIAPAELTGVLFHQSATPWAYPMTTRLDEANMEECGVTRATRVNKDQFDEGDWLDAEAMHVWRTDASSDMDTSLDVGAAAGTVIRSPVSGTVVHLRDYELFESLGDVEIHILPDGHPELDVVLIHTVDALVKAGDRVEAGVTELAHVRDIASALTDVQLMFYTEGDDPGNHVHIQVNDVNYPEYREKRLT